MHIVSALALATGSASPPATHQATTVSPSESGIPEPRAARKPDRDDEDEAIVVTGIQRNGGDLLGGVSVLDEEELTHDMKPSLGDTLADLPGVTASSFGPSSSRPILRGEQGERALILVDGI